MNIACFFSSDKVFKPIESILEGRGFHCDRLPTETALSRMVRRGTYDLLLIELGTDEASRESIFSWMSCRFGESTAVVMVSFEKNAELIAAALDAGGDDFLTMPVEPIELIARINAVLRRTTHRTTRRIIELVGFAIDRESRTVSYNGDQIELTPREFTMAWLFFSTPGVYISRETIGSAIWGVDSEIAGRTIEQHVYKLRKKLQMGIERGVMLRTAYNQGYRLELCETNPALRKVLQIQEDSRDLSVS